MSQHEALRSLGGPLKTPQSEPIPGRPEMVKNAAGGYVFEVSIWERFQRFLILGTEGGTFYVGERELSLENVESVRACLAENGGRAVGIIIGVSQSGRAHRVDPAIYALAMACSVEDDAVRSVALDAIPLVCRTGTHLFHFCAFVEQHRGWGRGLRRAVARWYEREDVDGLAYQLVKYRQRDGWSHGDVLSLAHPKPSTGAHAALFRWAARERDLKPGAQAGYRFHGEDPLPAIVEAFERAQAAPTSKATADLVYERPELPREALQTEHLTDPLVWEALLAGGMPPTALIRNLVTLTRVGLISPMAGWTTEIAYQLTDQDRLTKARVHPMSILAALVTYGQGYSSRSGLQWVPEQAVVDALNDAFYLSFGNVVPSGKRTLLALDVSGSMASQYLSAVPGLSARVAAAAMALITANVEPQWGVCAFTGGFQPLAFSPKMRLDQMVAALSGLPFDRTDCAVPMLWALAQGIEIDTFVIYTDNESWAGRIHANQALAGYRKETGIDAKLVACAMTATRYSVADPADPGMLDVVGFDTATPNVIAEFAR